MNLERIPVDREKDVAVVVATNFPEAKAEAATASAMEMLYRRYA